MKATGIIRRIDELGRVVIPKEIRRNLRIKDGENLEIFVENNENIVLKKYSIIKGLEDFAQDFTDAIHSFVKGNVIIADNDNVLAVSGNLKKDLLNKNISEDLEEKISRREEMIEKHKKKFKIVENKEIECTYTISPIILNGDAVGTILIIGTDENIEDDDFKIVKIASKFLNNHLS